VSYGHAFFLPSAPTPAAAIARPDARTIGFGVTEVLVWLPAAGIVAALAGMLVAPLATRLRGLYCGGGRSAGLHRRHVINEWSSLTGGPGVGRQPRPVAAGLRPQHVGRLPYQDQKLYC